MKDNIILIGMPGAGKSTLGVVLAKMMNYDFIDADLLIQQQSDKTLQRLIDSLGPDGFIEVENQVLSNIRCERTVLSTGGSAVYSDEAMAHLATLGPIMYLETSLEELKVRLADFSDRGVVMRDTSIASLEALYDERLPLYERYAEVTVNVDGLAITEAARKVVAALEGKLTD